MSNSIEIVDIHDDSAVHELAQNVYANNLPGFQIDGASSYQDIALVLKGLRNAAPSSVKNQIRFNDVSSSFTTGLNIGPHHDRGSIGLAVHHNIVGEAPVRLATLKSFKTQ